MQKPPNIEPLAVFKYFHELSQVPRGSGNMEAVSRYITEFAKAHSLKVYNDEACNVIIYKPATEGFEGKEPVILQGHLDMVCQKDDGYDIDFEKEGLKLYRDGDYIKAEGTTLGADNGIAVAMMLAILESNSLKHPPIEAVFTTDEEIGMIGALKLSMDKLKGKRMINIDSEDVKTVTVSCAGGSDFDVALPFTTEKKNGDIIKLSVKGLKGGHSGVEINSGRINANILMGRILNHIGNALDFDIISIDGGDKGNAIPVSSTAVILAKDSKAVMHNINEYAKIIKNEASKRESSLSIEAECTTSNEAYVMSSSYAKKLIYLLLCAPCGVVEMSSEIENLVETSLNLGIVKTENDYVRLLFTLRSNKTSALTFLEEKLRTYFSIADCEIKTGGHYPPWEYNTNSKLKELYIDEYKKIFGFEPSVEAIHAGLECGVFASSIPDFDCISIGPELLDIHTTKERLGITSTQKLFEVITALLAKM